MEKKYDRSAKYNAVIKDKAEELRRLCYQSGIPCFMAFGTSQDADGTYRIECSSVLPEVMGYEETGDRRFLNFVNVQNGFCAVPSPSENADDSTIYGKDFAVQTE